MKTVTLEVGNTSWWKNRKYRREAAKELRDVKVALERSQEQAKVSLHDRWWWQNIAFFAFHFIIPCDFHGLKRMKAGVVDFHR